MKETEGGTGFCFFGGGGGINGSSLDMQKNGNTCNILPGVMSYRDN